MYNFPLANFAQRNQQRHTIVPIGLPARLLAEPQPVFSLNKPWNAMIAEGTAYGIVHQGRWCDVGHPAGIAEAERLLHDAPHD